MPYKATTIALTMIPAMLISSPVYADWHSSSISINFFWMVIVPFFLIHLITSTILNIKGEYKSKKVAYTHFLIALLFPLLGIVLLIYEFFKNFEYNFFYYFNDFSLGLVVYVLLLAISALPYILSRAKS